MSCGIYKITNKVNNKVYIGQSINIEHRFQKHKSASDDFIIHKALKKYGLENFSFEIIEECSQEMLDEREKYWIDKYSSIIPNGYNMVPGGSNGAGLAKGKITCQYDINGQFIAEYFSAHEAARCTGINYSGICSCCRGERKLIKGYQWRYKDSDKNIEKLDNYVHTQVNVCQYDLSGNFIQKYSSLSEAADITGISKTSICSVCKGKYHTAGGFRWGYENEELLIKKRKKNKNAKPVAQYTKDDILIQQYIDAAEASKITKINQSNINQACNGKRKTAGGFIWKFI